MNKICVYAICKNESKFIDSWLASMSEADYIVVLDTGSTDGTFEKLKKDSRVTKVEKKIINPWRFDVARNMSMKLVPDDADILVCTDFDEVFNKGWAEIVRKAWDSQPNVTRILYQYAWSHNTAGEPTDLFIYDKIHNRDYEWIYPVHEVLSLLPDKQQVAVNVGTQVYLEHFQDLSKSRSNYLDLLKLSVEENPEDAHVSMLLAREYLIQKDYQTALDLYLKTIQMPEIDTPKRRLILLESLGRIANCYVFLDNYDEALWYCQEFIKEDPTYREPYFIMANVYADMKMYTLAEACVEAALKYSTRKNNWVERSDSWVSEANDILSICYYHLGDLDKAIEQINIALQHHPDDVRLLKNLNSFLVAKVEKLSK